MDSGGYQWCGQGKRQVLFLVLAAIVAAAILPFFATRPGHYIGMVIAAAVLIPFLIWWLWQFRPGKPLVSVNEVGLTPHEWSVAPIPWSEILRTQLDSQGIHSTLRIDTTESAAVRRALRPTVRFFVRLLGWWWVRSSGITVTLTMMSAADRAHFLDVLGELGYGPGRQPLPPVSDTDGKGCL